MSSTIDIFDRNPYVADLRNNNDPLYRAAVRDGHAPGLFGRGDLPAATASGNPPRDLLNLPWQLRHAATKADQAEWARLHNEYGRQAWEDGMAAMLGWEPAAQDPANDEYRDRVSAWASGLSARG